MGREEKVCPNCHKRYYTELQRYTDKPVQEEWPDEPAWKREQLVSGLCGENCWNQFLGVKPKRGE